MMGYITVPVKGEDMWPVLPGGGTIGACRVDVGDAHVTMPDHGWVLPDAPPAPVEPYWLDASGVTGCYVVTVGAAEIWGYCVSSVALIVEGRFDFRGDEIAFCLRIIVSGANITSIASERSGGMFRRRSGGTLPPGSKTAKLVLDDIRSAVTAFRGRHPEWEDVSAMLGWTGQVHRERLDVELHAARAAMAYQRMDRAARGAVDATDRMRSRG